MRSPEMIHGDRRFWIDRAEEARAKASEMHYEENKDVLVRLADFYDRMASLMIRDA
jgi:hypothetical protein